jgi:Dihydrodipicolinate synthetase family
MLPVRQRKLADSRKDDDIQRFDLVHTILELNRRQPFTEPELQEHDTLLSGTPASRRLSTSCGSLAAGTCIRHGEVIAGENFVLSRAEKRRVVKLAREHAPQGCLIVSGVNHESSVEAAREAATLEQAGADGLLVFAPYSWALAHADDCGIAHHRRVRDATAVPLMLYAGQRGRSQPTNRMSD